MNVGILYHLLLTLLVLNTSYSASREVSKRSITNSLADVLGIKGNGNKKKKAPVKVTPPIRLKPGETAEQPPGWQHCIKNMRATLTWKNIKSPGYPDFLESQIQCSWIIEAPINMRVKVAFRDLDMVGTTGSCAKQFAQIIDISTGKSQGRFCGSTRPGDYVTLGTKVRIDLQADKAVTKSRGFMISFLAVKEIPGFRSSKTFASSGPRNSESVGGKVNLNNFVSTNNNDGPKNPQGAKRANKRLVYESDRNPASTDASGSPTESTVIDRDADDPGWIGDDSDIRSGSNAPRAPNGGPLKVLTGGNRRRSSPPPNNGPVIITHSTLPVRIRAKNPSTQSPKLEEEGEERVINGPIIYGEENQPLYDPNLYTTLHPVRGNADRFVDHRPEVLSTTSVIIIVAIAVMFGVMGSGLVIFICVYRKRRNKRRKKKRESERKKKECQSQTNNVELKVMSLGEGPEDVKMTQIEVQRSERQRELPSLSPTRDSPPRYPDRHEFSYPRRGAMGQQNADIRVIPERLGLPTISGHSIPPMSYLPEDPRRHEHPPRDFKPYLSPERFSKQLPRHQTTDSRRHPPPMSASPMRYPNTLDFRNLGRDHPTDRRHAEFRGTEPPQYPLNNSRGIHPSYRVADYSKEAPRRQPSFTRKGDIDEDYCSGNSDDSKSGKTPMRREYSPWELEQQKKERRNKLISGNI